jgi:pyruvate/2-oxoglutarate dehydrogenase complex dihydrolipoamide dehydrogenase (E3) component
MTTLRVEPWDAQNQELVSQVHPPGWSNPPPASMYNLVVIGAGTAGLVTAAGAAGLGAKVALVERHLMGGDCLNVGCVPSKCIIRSARVMGTVRDAGRFGIRGAESVRADFGAVMERMRAIRARISHHDSVERFASLGVDVFLGSARFLDAHTIEVDGVKLRGKRIVIATGARAVAPPIPGLAEAGYLTNETIFSLTELPRRFGVIGAGPIGCELAQTFARLGAEVHLFEAGSHVLQREDPDAAAVVQASLARDGVRMAFDVRILRVEKTPDGKRVLFQKNGREESVVVDDLLAGAGRAPNVDGLNLEAAGVAFDPRAGVTVDDHLRTTNRNVYAAGDICMNWKFTHAADFAARIVIQNTLFGGRKRLSALTMPWCTYTEPELAHVGLSEMDAKAQGVSVTTFRRDMKDVDRALADGEEDGFVKIHVRQGTDEILGATIVASHAGDLISEISAAMAARMGLGKLASVIHPYPTQAEAIRQCGDAYNRTRLTPLVRSLFARYLAWQRG